MTGVPIHFTPTQQRMLDVLKDGKGHTLAELQACLDDELTEKKAVNVHLTYLRKKLRGLGRDVVAQLSFDETGRRFLYRQVRTMSSEEVAG